MQTSDSPTPRSRASRLARIRREVFFRTLTIGVVAVCLVLAPGCHPGGNHVSKANELTDRIYDNPEHTAQEAANHIVELQSMMTSPPISEHETFSKFREDQYWDRHTLSLCQNYLTIAECNVQMGALDAAHDSYLAAVEAANKWVGYHIQYVTNTSPQVWQTVRAWFRAKKVEIVAYLKARWVAAQQGNDALATVYELKARYAKLYLDSLLSIEEQRSVEHYEAESARMDDDNFLTDVETGFKFLVILVLLVVANDAARSLMSHAVITLIGIAAFSAILQNHAAVKASIRMRMLEVGIGRIVATVDRIAQLPELNNIPSFDEFKAAVERTRAAAEANDDTAAAAAFLESYAHLNQVEDDLQKLRAKYAKPGESTGIAPPGDGGTADKLSGNKQEEEDGESKDGASTDGTADKPKEGDGN